jgi:hypothetical protein
VTETPDHGGDIGPPRSGADPAYPGLFMRDFAMSKENTWYQNLIFASY